MNPPIQFINCTKCNKKLIVNNNGIGHFKFGGKNKPACEMFIMGTVIMRCPSCSELNTLCFFPSLPLVLDDMIFGKEIPVVKRSILSQASERKESVSKAS